MARLYFTEIPRLSDRKAMRDAEHSAGRQLLCDVLGCEASRVLLRDDGKPYLPGGPYFSISHSEGFILLAVSEWGEIGCDVERADRPLYNEAAIRRKIAFAGDPPHESCGISGDPEKEIPLLTLWVKKEAVFKAGGKGTVHYPAMPEGYIAAVCCSADEMIEDAVEKELQ